ncbi:MAG: helix-turn-helix domain-containing protein [Saccharolobus sp.]|uniref:helix-turn-helix domain-containing protein n=1 Tax=Saccharolobus sp. TaxID=2100761 RepID=UPI003167FFA3
MKKLYNVKIRVVHKDCWTEKVESSVKTLKISRYDRARVKAVVVSTDNIIKTLAKSENVSKVLKNKQVKGGYVIEFLENYSNTVAGTILNFEDNILSYENTVEKGIESWRIVTASNWVIKELRNKFNIDDFTVDEINVNNIMNFNLTEKEINVLKTSISMGYFEYPRRVKASDMAELLDISKQDFLYHLRNSIYKILRAISLDLSLG